MLRLNDAESVIVTPTFHLPPTANGSVELNSNKPELFTLIAGGLSIPTPTVFWSYVSPGVKENV